MISKTSAGGMFVDMASIKAKVMREANAFAESKGKIAVALESRETPGRPGRMPSFEYQFMIVDLNDPRADAISLRSRPDVVIEDSRRK